MDIGWTDAASRLWYMRWNGSQWTVPVELKPSEMTAIGGPAPVNFGPGSPLVACARPENRQTQSTEFVICDSKTLNMWDLSFDGSTWFVFDMPFSRMPYPPVQIKSRYKTSPPVPRVCVSGPTWTSGSGFP